MGEDGGSLMLDVGCREGLALARELGVAVAFE